MRHLILLTLIATSVLAEPVVLTKGQLAPFDGVLFTRPEELSIRYKLIERDTFKDLLDTTYPAMILRLKDNEKLALEETNLWRTQSAALAKQNIEYRDKAYRNSLLWFGGGILTTVLITFAVNKVSK